ncbi:MAG: hypothetical protein A3E88_06205 [Legionellales bacterium RIFCSPHIGHO2_12_FULL_35_11]|nr:MAG: hypothetical protein A3E88_06205 [Legionellales bacterium RIFCSPHIGHO2_12_FULL_35_11]
MASQQVEQVQEVKPKDVDLKQQKKFTHHLIHDCTLACNDFQSKDFDLEKAKRITADRQAYCNYAAVYCAITLKNKLFFCCHN